jgi:hypothetical protein
MRVAKLCHPSNERSQGNLTVERKGLSSAIFRERFAREEHAEIVVETVSSASLACRLVGIRRHGPPATGSQNALGNQRCPPQAEWRNQVPGTRLRRTDLDPAPSASLK